MYRRRFVAAAGSALVGLCLPAGQLLAAVATPRQSEGPFYPLRLPLDSDNDLARVRGHDRHARGEIFHLAGRVRDAGGRPLAGARVEIWQCDAGGVYRHPGAPRQSAADPGFQGFGMTLTAADGGYRFRTITPVPYPGRTPHIHFKLIVAGRGELVTQMYLDGHPLNGRDALLSRISDPQARAALLVRPRPAGSIEPGSVQGRFDIVVG